MSEISASHHLESVIGTRAAHAVDEEAKATMETCAVVDLEEDWNEIVNGGGGASLK